MMNVLRTVLMEAPVYQSNPISVSSEIKTHPFFFVQQRLCGDRQGRYEYKGRLMMRIIGSISCTAKRASGLQRSPTSYFS